MCALLSARGHTGCRSGARREGKEEKGGRVSVGRWCFILSLVISFCYLWNI